MKAKFSDYIKKLDISVLVAMAVYKGLQSKYPSKNISKIAETTSGGTPSRGNAEYYNGNIPWLKSGELNDGFISCSEETITTEGLKNSSAKLFPKGTLLIAMYGATTGKVALLDIESSTNQAICAVFPNDEIHRDYLFWFFRQHRYEFIQLSKGGAQPNISQSVINNTKVPIPSIYEQKNIAQFLFSIEKENKISEELINQDLLDDIKLLVNLKQKSNQLSTELNQQLALVKELRQAYLREAMQGKLVAQSLLDEPAEMLLEKIKAEKEKLLAEGKIKQGKIQAPETQEKLLFFIPYNWRWCKLDDICTYITDGTHQTPNYTKKGKIFLSAQNIKPFRFMPEEHRYVSEEAYKEYVKNRKAEKEDLLVARVGAGIGEAAVIDRDIDFAFYVSLGLVKPFKNFVNTKYLAVVFNSPYGVAYSKSNISSKGGSAGNFNLGRIRSFLVPLPPLAEQERIVAKLEKLMKFCDDLEQNIKQSIQQAEMLLETALREALQPSEVEQGSFATAEK
ncbi:MAG: restriction endonuclease subunit S [Blastocatellia bacterium]